MRILIHIVLFFVGSVVSSQSELVLSDLDDLFEEADYSKFIFEGYLEKSLPVTIAIGRVQDEVSGYIYYGSNMDRYDLLGSMDSSGDIELYEFDKNSRVTGKIIGDVLRPFELFSWKTPDERLSLSLILHNVESPPKRVQLFESTIDEKHTQVFLREDLRQMTISKMGNLDLRWIDFICQGEDCIESRYNIELTNPVEFSLKLNNKKEILVYPNDTYEIKHSLDYANTSIHSFDSFHSYNYPILDDKTFDTWINKEMALHIPKKQEEEVYRMDLSQRFAKRNFKDFYITLFSNNILSGYLYDLSNNSNQVQTTSFIYDLNKSKFYKIEDLFKRDFDYAFFLKGYITKAKRGDLSKENRSIQQLIKEADYKHYVLTPEGILFFTDFNVVYGRREILIPYEEINNYLDNKNVENYLKKERL